MDFKKILFFDSFLMPKIITFFYWIAIISWIIGGISLLINGSVVGGLSMIIGGPILSRLYSELIIVIFTINGNLQKIADKGKME